MFFVEGSFWEGFLVEKDYCGRIFLVERIIVEGSFWWKGFFVKINKTRKGRHFSPAFFIARAFCVPLALCTASKQHSFYVFNHSSSGACLNPFPFFRAATQLNLHPRFAHLIRTLDSRVQSVPSICTLASHT